MRESRFSTYYMDHARPTRSKTNIGREVAVVGCYRSKATSNRLENPTHLDSPPKQCLSTVSVRHDQDTCFYRIRWKVNLR